MNALSPSETLLTSLGLRRVPGAASRAARSWRGLRESADHLIETLAWEGDRVTYRAGWYAPESDAGAPQEVVSIGRLPAAAWSDARAGYSASAEVAPEALAMQLARWRAEAIARGAWLERAPEVPMEEADFFLLAPDRVATYREWIEDTVTGWGRTAVVKGERAGATARATLEQSDSRGDRYRFDVVRSGEGVAAEIRGGQGLVVHDWIWRFPLVEREWTEETDEVPVSMQLYPVGGPVETEAGTFWGCWRLSTMNPNGSSAHTYHPRAGLVLSEFTDIEGVPGRRELVALEVLKDV